MHSKRILIGCGDLPGYGGASTAAYELFYRMQADGLNVQYVSLSAKIDREWKIPLFSEKQGNLYDLTGYHAFVAERDVLIPNQKLRSLLRSIRPDILLAFGWIGAWTLKTALPDVPCIMLTTGCKELIVQIQNNRIRDLQEFQAKAVGSDPGRVSQEPKEGQALELSDYVIPHAEVIRLLYDHFFPNLDGKIDSRTIWFAEWIHSKAQRYGIQSRPFDQRKIDVLFIACDWDRTEKNYPFVQELAASLKGKEIHLVGNYSQGCPGVVHHGFIARYDKLMELMGNAKTVACPSRFDSAPGILFEASALGCNIVASKNCGNWEICHDDLLARILRIHEFQEKIHRSLTKKYDDRMEIFMKKCSYERLKAMLETEFGCIGR